MNVKLNVLAILRDRYTELWDRLSEDFQLEEVLTGITFIGEGVKGEIRKDLSIVYSYDENDSVFYEVDLQYLMRTGLSIDKIMELDINLFDM